jgi:hypothetical protein
MTFPLTILFMFMVFWRPQEWLFPWLYGWPLLDGVVYAALLSLVMEINQGQARFPKTPAVMLAGGLWFATIVSHMPHTYFQGIINTLPESFKYSFFLILLLTVIDRISRARTVVLLIVASTCVMAVHCVMQAKLGHGFAGQTPIMRYRPLTDVWQAQSLFFGIFSDPNDAAQMLATAIPLVFAYPRRLNPVTLVGCSMVAGLFLWALYATHSRGGQISLAAVFACMVFLKMPTRWMPYLGVIGLLGGLVICAFKGGGMLDASSQERVVFWGMANREFKGNLIFGLGYGMFWQVTQGARAAHNAFVSCYTELGLFGYWFWFGLLQLGVIGCWKSRLALSRPRNAAQAYMRRLAGLSIVSMAGFAAGGYFLSRAFVFPLFFLFGLLNAIPLIVQRQLPEDNPPLINPRSDVYGMGTVSTLGSVLYIYVTILILNKAFYG